MLRLRRTPNQQLGMLMLYKKLLLVISLLILNSGCQSTYRSLTKPIPDKYIEVVPSDPGVDVAAALEASGKPYVCKEMYFGHNSSKNRKACFIKLPEDDQLERLKVRMEGTPEAILLDTGKNILNVGYVFLEVLFIGYVPLFQLPQ